MPKEITRLEFTKEELKEALCQLYGLDKNGAKLHLDVTRGSAREPGYTKIWIEGQKTGASDVCPKGGKHEWKDVGYPGNGHKECEKCDEKRKL